MAEPMDERELERLMREGLEQRAVGVDESAASELVAAARSGASRRSWRTTATIGLAAASVAGVALATLVLDDEDIRSGGRDDDVVAPVPQDWRLEAWHGVTVRVPADWGWGGAPMADSMPREEGGDDRLVDCGASAFVGADGQRLVDGDGSIPYVGRPVYMTDVCSVVGLREEPPPTAPYVWLGSPIDVGEVDLGNGYTQETVEVAGETVTVATDDPELREQILATATPAPTGELDCPTSFPDTPEIVAVPREGVADPVGITVCVLQRDGDAGPVNLVYSTRVGATAARAFKLALRRNPAAANPYCVREPAFEWVLLKIEGADGVRQDNLVHLGRCAGIELLPGDGPVNLNDETVAPWAVDGIPAYVVGPQGELRGLDSSFFRGMLG
jgi:hypothetical protein